MDNNLLDIKKNNTDEEYRVTLPCGADQFTSFVSSLLGKGQSLEKGISFYFELDLCAIENLHHLITQRLSQNVSQHIAFSAKIYFDNRSSVQLNNVDDFFTYREVKNITSNELLIEWVFLVTFPEVGTPEKQSISIRIQTNISDNSEPIRLFGKREGDIQIMINHSNRSFGNDILNLIENHFENYKYKESKVISFYRNFASSVSIISSLLLFCTGLYGIFVARNYVLSDHLEEILRLSNEAHTVESLAHKVQFLLDNFVSPIWAGFYISTVLYVVLLIIGSVVLGFFVNDSIVKQPRSFLLLTEESVELRKKYSPTSIYEALRVFGQLFLGLLIGVVANVIFTMIWY